MSDLILGSSLSCPYAKELYIIGKFQSLFLTFKIQSNSILEGRTHLFLHESLQAWEALLSLLSHPSYRKKVREGESKLTEKWRTRSFRHSIHRIHIACRWGTACLGLSLLHSPQIPVRTATVDQIISSTYDCMQEARNGHVTDSIHFFSFLSPTDSTL